MYHGHYTAINIHQRMRSELIDTIPKFVELDESPPVICIAVGKQAAAWSEANGTLSGADILDLYFNDDLGYKST